MNNSFDRLRPEIKKSLRENAKQYDSVKRLIYRLRGTVRYDLTFEDVKDVIYWGGANRNKITVSEVFNAIFKN